MPPGQHGQKNLRKSDYGNQLREKQKVRRIYGVLERQFRERVPARPTAAAGSPARTCCRCWRAGSTRCATAWVSVSSRSEARQIVRHNGIVVNGKRVNIPSYQVRPGDVVEVAEKAKGQLRVKGAAEAAEGRGFPEWIEVDIKALKGTFKALPQRSELPPTINESLVVELYSK